MAFDGDTYVRRQREQVRSVLKALTSSDPHMPAGEEGSAPPAELNQGTWRASKHGVDEGELQSGRAGQAVPTNLHGPGVHAGPGEILQTLSSMTLLNSGHAWRFCAICPGCAYRSSPIVESNNLRLLDHSPLLVHVVEVKRQNVSAARAICQGASQLASEEYYQK